MGHRALLLLIEDGGVSVRYDHWAAADLGNRLVLGPDYTLRWLRQQEAIGDRPSWDVLDDVWVQGGVTADLDRLRLTWFELPGHYDLQRRRVVLALLDRMWPGWTVRYAERGIHDVAEAAGAPSRFGGDRIFPPEETEDVAAAADPPEMSAALAEFVAEFVDTHAPGAVHPAIKALEALESLLRLPPGAVNPAIADHHPLAATADEIADVVSHAAELKLRYHAAERGPVNPPDRWGQ